MAANRGAPRAPKTDPKSVALNAAAEKARKAKSKKALAATRAKPVTAAPVSTQTPEAIAARKAQDAVNALAAMRVDYDATVSDLKWHEDVEAFNTWLADQGFAPDGTVLSADPAPTPCKVDENHPMYALVVARKHYAKAANGNQCNGDPLAIALGGLNPPQVIRCLLDAMALEANPYPHLNIGQQSMNLRNKARGQIKNGLLKMDAVVSAIEKASRTPEAA